MRRYLHSRSEGNATLLAPPLGLRMIVERVKLVQGNAAPQCRRGGTNWSEKYET